MSTYEVTFHKDIATDYNDAYDWYETQQEGLGIEFLKAFRDKVATIASNPDIYSTKLKRNYREANLERFPYTIVYQIYSRKKIILVNALHHQKKKPNKKYRK